MSQSTIPAAGLGGSVVFGALRTVCIIALIAMAALALFLLYHGGINIYVAFVRNEFYHPIQSTETVLDRAFSAEGFRILRLAARTGWIPLTAFLIIECIAAFVVSTTSPFKSGGLVRRYGSAFGLTFVLALILCWVMSPVLLRLLFGASE